MAIKPYQRTGLMTTGFQPSQGYALKEAQNTQLVMADQLDRMSSFFFKQAAAGFEKKGKEYGSSVVPSLEQISIATADPEDDKELNMPSFNENTIYGRAAKKEALLVLENRLTVQATEAFNQSVFDANKNGHTPATLRTGLDGTIKGITDTVNAVSPVFARKMEAKLAMTAAGHFQNYRIQYLAASKKATEKDNLTALEYELVNLGSIIDAQLQFSELTMTGTELIEVRQTLREEYKEKVILAFETVNQQQTQMEKWDNTFLNHINAHIIQELVAAEKITSKTVKDITLENDLGHKIDAVLDMMDTPQRLALANEIKARIKDNAETETRNEKKAEATNKEKITALRQKYFDITSGTGEQSFEFSEAVNVLEELKTLGKDGVTLAETLNADLVQGRGLRLVSDIAVLRRLSDIEDSFGLEYDTLYASKDELSAVDFKDFKNKIDKREQNEIKQALKPIAIALEVNPDRVQFGEISPEKGNDEAIYFRVKRMLELELEIALAEKKSFDAYEAARRIYATKNVEIRQEILAIYKDSADAVMPSAINLLKENNIRKDDGTDWTVEDYTEVINAYNDAFTAETRWVVDNAALVRNIRKNLSDYVTGLTRE
tara:strand:+ start:904 stop:2718 length:1815 start_codon:yes stop_codon:yes gene_type:complete